MIASMGAVGLVGFSSSNTEGVPIPDEEDLPSATPFVEVFEGPAPTIDGTEPHIATIETSQGTIEIELSTEAPTAVNSFAFLAGKGFYNGATFFYVDHDYFAQAGDPTCTTAEDSLCSGVGGPGYTLASEETSLSHEPWAVVLPAVNAIGEEVVHGSQFRILYTPDERLDGSETVFGTVTSGQDILEGLPEIVPCSAVDSDDCTEDMSAALVIESVTVRPA